MKSRNRVELIGHLGKDPEVFKLENGQTKVSFTMATTESYTTNQGEKNEITDWHNVVAFGNVAEWIEKSLKKGTKVLVEGKIKTRSYQDKEGKNRYVTEVLCRDFMYMSVKESQESQGHTPPLPTTNEEGEDDLPF